jgi:hypothetical protein
MNMNHEFTWTRNAHRFPCNRTSVLQRRFRDRGARITAEEPLDARRRVSTLPDGVSAGYIVTSCCGSVKKSWDGIFLLERRLCPVEALRLSFSDLDALRFVHGGGAAPHKT